MKNEIKWAWQRVTRGYDDRLFWDVDAYLSPIIRDGLTYLRENGHGYPSDISLKKWNKALDTMILGFSEEPVDMKLFKKHYQNKQKALALFAAYYNNLWD